MRLAKAAHSVFLFTGQLIRSSLGDGANGAGTGAGTAINAGTLVDLANAAGILDGTDGANTHAQPMQASPILKAIVMYLLIRFVAILLWAAQCRQRNGKYRPVTQPV